MTASQKGAKDGRHIGLDFYDLLIEPILPIDEDSNERDRIGEPTAGWPADSVSLDKSVSSPMGKTLIARNRDQNPVDC